MNEQSVKFFDMQTEDFTAILAVERLCKIELTALSRKIAYPKKWRDYHYTMLLHYGDIVGTIATLGKNYQTIANSATVRIIITQTQILAMSQIMPETIKNWREHNG